jgi:hypothetical protein
LKGRKKYRERNIAIVGGRKSTPNLCSTTDWEKHNQLYISELHSSGIFFLNDNTKLMISPSQLTQYNEVYAVVKWVIQRNAIKVDKKVSYIQSKMP